MVTDGSAYCTVHSGQLSPQKTLFALIGAVVGNAVVPGLGGIALGALAGSITDEYLVDKKMAKKPIFISFDFDNDRTLKEFVIGQALLDHSPFSVIDHSLKEAAPEKDWEAKARRGIKKSALVLVMVGMDTYRAPGVLKEIAMAREENIKVVQMIGYKDGNYTPVPGAGRLYSWSWENLENLLG
jgi:hypothetical protein